MTREQIEYKRKACLDGTWIPDGDEYLDLLAAAERALVLEDVLAAAKELHAEWVLDYASLKTDALIDELRAAIDLAEGKP